MRITRKQRRARQRRQKMLSCLKGIVHTGVKLATAAMLAISSLNPLTADAMPANGQVTAGSAVINQAGSVMTIQQQTAQAAINWKSFNIAAHEKVQFFQPGKNSVALNRVVGSNASAIYGSLTANGRVFLVNPNGVFFAPGAQVNVGGLVASTLSISDTDFMAGRYTFTDQGGAQSVINQGGIVAENQGLVALLAPDVKNEGIIVAKKGSVVLAAGKQATLDFAGDGKVQLALGEGALQAAVENKGLIEADGGLVLMTARTGHDLTSAVVNQSGIVRARSLDGKAGSVAIHAVDGTAQVAGTVDASAASGKGGTVDVFGKDIAVAGEIDASGSAGGGKVRIGGDWQGTGDAPHARTVAIDQGAVIHVDAVDSGAGGTVAVWSDGITKFDGTISARGGAQGGDGGSAETSGRLLQVGTGSVDASAVQGKAGEWLLDPTTIAIVSDEYTGGVVLPSNPYQPAGDSSVKASTINSVLDGGTSVSIKTSTPDGTIVVNEAIAKTGGTDARLTLQAHQDIYVNANIGSTSGKLNVDLHADTNNTGGGRIVLASGATISTNGGWATLHGGDGVTNATDGSVTGGASKYAKNIVNDANPGVEINGAINSNGGNITIYGETTAINSIGAAGVFLSSTGQLINGGGSISINGALSGTPSSNVSAVTLEGAINAGTGSVIVTGDRGNAGSSGTGINFAAAVGKGIIAKDVTLIADTMAFPGAGMISGTGAVWLKPLTASRSINVGTGSGGLDLTKTGLFTNTLKDFAQIRIGHETGTGTITVNNAIFGTDVTLQATGTNGNIQITGALGAGENTVTLIADTNSGGAGAITAGGLNLQGTNAAFTMNGANDVDTLAGNVKSVAFTDTDGFTVGTAGGTNGLTITDNSTLTASGGNITVGKNITKTVTTVRNLTLSAENGTVAINGATVGNGGGKLNVAINAGALSLADTISKISANGGNITLKVNAMTLPASGIAGGLVTSSGGVLNIDRLASGGTIDIGGSTSGALQINAAAFGGAAPVFGDGFSQINIGHVTTAAGGASTSANTTAVILADNKQLTVTDSLYIKAASAINLRENSGIDSSGGGNALTLEAPAISFPGTGTGFLYAGNTINSILTLRANTISNWGGAQFKTAANHGGIGKLFIEPLADNTSFTVGGSSSFVNNTAFSRIADGNFRNVTVGKATAGAVTISDISSLPAYTTILSPGAATLTGDITGAAGTLAIKTGSLTQTADSDLILDKLLLLGGVTGDFSLTAGTNTITTVAAELEKGLALTTADDLAVGTVQDRTGATDRNVDGITAKTGNIKLTVAKPDGTLALNQKVYSGTSGTGSGRITLVADELGLSTNGKVRTSGVLQLYPYTTGREINIGTVAIDGLNITADKFASSAELGGAYEKIILGRLSDKFSGTPDFDDDNQTGNINIGKTGSTTTFTSNLELRTKGDVRLDGRVNVGTAAPWKDPTITANKLTMPDGSNLYVHELNLNLASGLDLSDTNKDDVGEIKGGAGGKLTINVPSGKDIYISDTYIGGAYKIPYVTINDVFTGFNTFGVTGDRNVFFHEGAINKSVTVKAGGGSMYGVTVENNVDVSGPNTKVDISGGRFTMNTGTKLNITGGNAIIDIKAASNDIFLANGAKLIVNGDNAKLSLTAADQVNMGVGAEVGIADGKRDAVVTVSSSEFVMSRSSKVSLGNQDSGSLTLKTNKLTANEANTDGIVNITGKGALTLMQKDSGTALFVVTDTYKLNSILSGLVVTDTQLSGNLFGSGFTSLTLGNAAGGLVTIAKHLSDTSGVRINNNVTIQTGGSTDANGTITIGAGGLTVGDGNPATIDDKAVTLKAGKITNTASQNVIDAGTGTINIYTNNLDELTGTNVVIGSGTLGIATYDGTTAISLGNTTHGGIHLPDSKFSTVFGSGFSAYAIGNSDQKIMHVDNSTLSKNTILTADKIYFHPDSGDGNSINVGDKTLTVIAATEAIQNGGKITAQNVELSGGNFNLQGNNAISNLTAAAKQVKVKSTTAMNIDGIDTTSGGATGDVILTADTMTFTPGTEVKGNGVLTVQQASNDRKVNIGTNPDSTDALYLISDLFNGNAFKDGFKHVYLGNENSTAAVKVGGDLTFVDPTTIRSHKKQTNWSPAATDSIMLAADAHITTTVGSSLELVATKLTTTAGSTIMTGGDLTLTVDNMDLTGNNANPPIRLTNPESSKLYIQTLSQDRDLAMGRFANTIQSDQLVLQSTYFDGVANENNPANQRVFADGYSQIVLGRTDGTGTLYQDGTTGFSDEVLIRQASDNTTGSVDVRGEINTGGNNFMVESKIVNIDATIDAEGGDVSLTADKLAISDDSSIKSEGGDLTIKSFSKDTDINLGGTNMGNPGDLNLESKWFDGDSRVFKESFSKITIGRTDGEGTITVKDNFSVTDDLTLQNGTGSITVESGKMLGLNNNNLTINTTTGTISIPGTVTEVKTLEISTGSSVSLNNPGNTITNIGNVTAKNGIEIKDKDGVTVTGTVTNTGAGKDVTIHTTGNISISKGGSVNSEDEVFLVAQGGNFTNGNTGAGDPAAIDADNRWVVYTDKPEGNTPGNLGDDTDFHRYGTEYGDKAPLVDNAPSGGTDYSGSGFAYNYRPKAVIYGEKVYGQAYAYFFEGGKLRVTADGVVVGSEGNAWEQAFLDYLLNGATFNGKSVTASANYNVGTGLGAATNVNAPGTLYGSAYGSSAHSLGASYTGANPFNYDMEIQLRVTPKEVTVTANNHSKIYDGTAYGGGTHGVAYAGFVNGQNETTAGISGSVSYDGSAKGAKNVGAYSIDIDGDLQSGNYTFKYVDGNLTITPKEVTVTANSHSKVYDGLIYTNGTHGVSYNGFVAGEDASVITGGTVLYGGNANGAKNAGSYGIDISGNLGAGNYTFKYVDGNLTITPKEVTVTANSHSKVYDGQTYTTGTHGVSYNGFVTGEDASVITGGTVSYGGNANGAKNAGEYDIDISGSLDAGNYTFKYMDGKLTIDKKEVTVTANSHSKVYDGQTYTTGTHGVSYVGFVSGEGTSAIKSGDVSYGGSANGAKNAGSYGVDISGNLDADNYAFNYVDGKLTITPKTLMVTAENVTKVYDGNAYTGGNGVSYDGFIVGENSSVLGGTLGYGGDSQGAVNVKAGGYVITPGGLTSSNYEISYQNGTLTITPRPITITVDDAGRYYGYANPTEVGGRLTGGSLAGSDSIRTVAVKVDLSATPTANAGTTHGIKGQDTSFATGEAGNYNVTYVDGTLTITKAPLTIIANDQKRTQSSENPELTVRYEGLVNNEQGKDVVTSLNVTTPANKGSRVGEYDITPADGTAQNYEITYQKGKLVVEGLNPEEAKAVKDAQTQKPGTPPPSARSVPGLGAPVQHFAPPDPAVPPVNTGNAPGLPASITGEAVIQTSNSSNTHTFVSENGSFGFTLRGGSGEDRGFAGGRKTSGAVPVLYADGNEQKLDGIYTINYNPSKLSIMPSAQSVTIPRLEEVAPDINRGFSLVYRTQSSGSFEVAFGNGIVSIHPLDPLAVATVTGQSKEAGRAVLATGVLTAVEDLGVMPDQIRAIYIFTGQEKK